MINSLTGGMCERMSNLFQSVSLKSQEHSYKYNEAGLPSDELADDICEALAAIGCVGGGGGNGGGTTNPNLSTPGKPVATDGAYSDHVNIQWPASVASGEVTLGSYRIYRSLNTNTNPNLAELIATVTAPTTSYDDYDVTGGVFYNYWIRAYSDDNVNFSAFSQFDSGNSTVPIGELGAISDLRTTYGFGGITSAIALDWTPPSGATKFDIYRGTTNVFASATKIYSNVVPEEISLSHDTGNPECWDNGERITLYDTPPSNAQDYYYWVVAKGDSPPAESDESNSSLGRVLPPSIYNQTTEILDFSADSYVVPAGITKMWAVIRGGGGGGAGGGSVYGGGGGGGGGTVRIALTVAEGDAITIDTLSQADSGNAAQESPGSDCEPINLYVNAVLQATADSGGGGSYSPSGGGAGGSGGNAVGYFGSPVVYDGTDGQAASGANGGQSGYAFGGRRLPQADPEGSYNGDGFVGSGAKAISYNPTIAIGGKGLAGAAYLTFGT